MSDRIDPHLASVSEQAAEWVVCLSDDRINQQQRIDFETWLAQDPRHKEAYAQADSLWHSLAPRKTPLRAGINLIMGVILLAGSLFSLPLSEWLADERTGVGEMCRLTLSDGSQITLDSNSAVDIAFDEQQRRIILHRGRLLAEVAPDPSSNSRPFIVENRDGTAQALGTRYSVEQTRQDSQINVLESQVAVASRFHPDQPMVLQAGQSIRLNSNRLHEPEPSPPFAESWLQARLIYQDAPLQHVIRDLARYRSGFIKVGEAAGKLRFTGVLPTDNPATALSILEDALPIRAKHHSQWFVWIDVKQSFK